jgi:Outer membrane protein beta-barrel domain
MRKVFGILALSSILLLAVVPASAQDAASEEEKDLVEISVFVGKGLPQGGIKSYQDSLGAKSGFETGIEAGYFFSPNVVLGFHLSYTQFGIDDAAKANGLDHKLYFPALYLKYLVNSNSNFVPYVKVLAGLQNPKFTRYAENVEGNRYRALSYGSTLGYSLGAGIFYYTADYSGLYLEACYSRSATEESESTYAGKTYLFGETVESIDLRMGIRFLIGSSE